MCIRDRACACGVRVGSRRGGQALLPGAIIACRECGAGYALAEDGVTLAEVAPASVR